MGTQNNQQLTKKERKELRRQEREKQLNQTIRNWRTKKIAIWSIGVVLVAGLISWGIIAGKQAEENKHGEQSASQGQEHIQNGAEHPAYNSNPPTSGWHYQQPAKAGFYDKPMADETLLHNLEHGHVVISYNCEKEIKGIGMNLIPRAYADHSPSMSETANISLDTSLPESFNNESCKRLKEKLEDIVKGYKTWKIVAVPRPANETLIALTAWTRLQKLELFDADAINAFIKAYRNRGPENTPE